MSSNTPFVRRVAGVLATRVARFAIGIAISFLLARILLPAGRGQYALLILVPGMLMALGQLGLPSAISFFAGRGRSSRDLERLAWVLAIALSLVLVAITWLALPWLTATILKPAPEDLLAVSLAALPFQFAAAFTGAALIGRQRMRNYNLILVGQSIAMLVLVVVLVGILRLGVAGAVIAYVAVSVLTAVATGIELRRMVHEEADRGEGQPVTASQLTGYGLRVYPASVTGYLSYRSDVLVLSAILADPAAIGFYTFAVSLAELSFFIPDSVSTVFFPRVAGMDPERASALTPQVSRFTVLLTALASLAIIPAAILAILVLLPEFVDSIPAFLVLMPGIVAFSISKVLAGYLSGIGLPLSVAGASGANLAINLAANIILIPLLGIVGAALASVISYASHATILVLRASTLSRRRPVEYVIPTRAEFRRLASGVGDLWRRVHRESAA
jgi:O-antigen/teichoic acid export membrane protein